VGADNVCHQAIFMKHASCAVTPLDPLVSGWVPVAVAPVADVAMAAGAGRVRAGLVRAGGAGAGSEWALAGRRVSSQHFRSSGRGNPRVRSDDVRPSAGSCDANR
jgi:hypothetical protein